MSAHLPSLLVVTYFLGMFLVTIRFTRHQNTANGFMNATGSLPTWVATVSFLAANCGALEIVGLSGIAARYGVQAFHFYWIGAIPAMVFVSFVMLPIYQKSGVRSVPEYLERRFGRRVSLLNAFSLLASTCLTAGISLYALSEILHVFGGWTFTTCALVSALVVMTNVWIGGFRATVRTEILHFFVMLIGLVPMLYLSVHLSASRAEIWTTQCHLWRMTPLSSTHSPVDLVGVIFGLGIVVSFSYWCTDFLLLQRALAARTTEAARRVPLYAGFGKLLFSFIVVLPVVLAGRSIKASGSGALDQTSPVLMQLLYSPKYLPLGILALVAALMTSLGGNVSAFASLWTQEIYRRSLRPNQSEQHYILIGRLASVLCLSLSLVSAYATLHFESLSEFMLVIFSLTVVPFFAVVVIGAFSRRRSSTGALTGVLCGIAAGGSAQIAYRMHWLHAGSDLSANFYTALVSFSTALIVSIAGNLLFSDGRQLLSDHQVDFNTRFVRPPSMALYVVAGLLLACCALLNVIWS
jgi:solute:Na+ symporter, SSS family